MTLDEFVGLPRDEVVERIQKLTEEEKRALLAQVVMRVRGNPGRSPRCPRCREGLHRVQPKIVDRRGRVWHLSCATTEISTMHPDEEALSPA